MLALLLVTTASAFTSCQRETREDETPAVEEDAPPEPSENGAAGSESLEPQVEEDDLPPVIYYDLTRFDWYARGEPMRLDDGAYAPGGAPVRAATSEMEKVGEYEGVEYYARDDASGSEGVVYVPVFEGFWLPFVRE